MHRQARRRGPAALVSMFLIFLLVLSQVASATTIQHINNSALRFGNSGEASITDRGLLKQPFYYSSAGNTFYPLTFSNYPLDFAFGYGTGGGNWTGNTVYDVGNTAPSSLTVDYSGLTATGGGINGGYGTVIATANFTLGGNTVRFRHTYTLGQNDDFIRIETQVTNTSGNTLSSTNMWVGTRDDWVGGTDSPTKARGNVTGSGFQAISNSASASNAIQITSGSEGVLFYTVTPNAASVIHPSLGFQNVYNQNPTTASTGFTGDDSYGMYFPVGSLAPNASSTVVWFYAAGSIQDLTNVAQQVAAAGAAEQTLNVVTTDGGTLNYNFNYSGTAYYMVVDRGSTAPTGAQIVAAADYGSVTKRASGNAVLAGSGSSWSTAFNITGLAQATQYTVYTTTRYPDPNDNTQTLTSSVESVNFSTRPTAPTGITITPSSQQLSVAFTAPANITNIQYSTDGGSTWTTRNPASAASPLVIGSLTNGTSYSVQLRGVFDGQSGTATSTVTATAGSVPGVPQNVSIVYGATSGATVTWDTPASNGGNSISGYTVEYKKDGNWLPLSPNVRSVEISDVWVNVSWQFRVAASNVIGTGSFLTLTNTPAPPAVTGGGTTTLVTQSNQSSITATPGNSVVGTVNNGVVTPVAATVTRVTSTTAADIQTDIASIVTNFNQRWDGTGTNPSPPVSKVATNDGALIYGLVSTATNSTPIGVPADDVILITTNDQAVLLAAANGDQPASVNSSGALVVNDGSVLGFAVNGFAPNTQGELVIMSNPTMLGTFTTDANGSFSGQAVIPAGFPVGNHTAVLITSNLVTSMGLVVEAKPSAGGVPYLGPMLMAFSTRNLAASSATSIVVDGVRLSTIETIRIANLTVPFLRRQTGDLVLSLPALPAGTYDLVITYSGGARLIHQAVFTVSERFTNSVPSTTVRITSFAGNSFVLTSAAKRTIQLNLDSYDSIEKVICTGSTSGTRATAADRRLAAERARAACNYVKQLRPSALIEIKSNPAAGVGPRFRNVSIQVIEN
ncbi:unannotated protein [freshwater metagenome]|uniref:Unannotated protein n=1 Tax=freshwater metagenome TaxID=449393 RepID=A0A6J6E1F8_9ZZZZ|nr:hypothetical protein [Actinomycetota bacterium]